MKIFSAAQIKACDAYTVQAASISSADLMERAAAKCVDWICSNYPKDTLFVVLCGTGNNGGDGLALTRMLHRLGFAAKAFLLQLAKDLSPDCRLNFQRLRELDPSLVAVLQEETFITDIAPHIVIVDAILGTGLNRPVEGWVADFIRYVNQLPNQKIAIDIPSGLPADTVSEKEAAVLKAASTLSFEFYKRSFLHPETGVFTGEVHILDIGLDPAFIEATHTNYNIIDKAALTGFYHPREPFSHKGTFGTAWLVGGSYGMIGAISLSARAAYRAGAGKVIGLVPSVGYGIFQSAVPEALCYTTAGKIIDEIKEPATYDSIGIGPGLGTEPKTVAAFAGFIESCKKPLVVDADALNILAEKPELLNKIPPGSILTPHPGEFQRLFGSSANSMIRLEHARTQAMKYNIIIVLKDRFTAVVLPEGECWYNIKGNAGLATAGAGDVLTGLLTGLLAQGYEPGHAALLGVYLHAVAADLALGRESMESLMAGDITEFIGAAFKTLS